MIGSWVVKNKKLKERLNNCIDWTSFSGTMQTKKVLNGLCVYDEMVIYFEKNNFCGLSLRMFNPQDNTWTIYWADTNHPELGLTEQVCGKFENGFGVFYSETKSIKKKVRVRFLWSAMSEDIVQWEQEFFDDNNDNWETNWIMKFTRTN